ncbi:MAG: DUF3048 domain-containing protein [Bacillota bacterium]
MVRWFRKNVFILSLGCLALVIGLGSYYYIGTLLAQPASAGKEPQEVEENEDQDQTGETQATERCPLDGAPLEYLPERRPLAVMIDNAPQARPQSGLNKADVVIEAPAEGGVTRFMAVFYHGEAEEIGPVRSARPYFIDRARDYGAIYVHAGWSPQAKAYLEKGTVPYINEFRYGSWFYRSSRRSAPHNLYSNTEKLWSLAEKVKIKQAGELQVISLLAEQESPTGGGAQTLVIYYPQKDSKVRYEFDAVSGKYRRFQGDEPQNDNLTGDRLEAANVIVQYVPQVIVDGVGRLEMKMLGEGEARVYTNGQARDARWSKKGLDQPTTFVDAQGEPIPLKPGQTWIQVVATGTRVENW